MNAVAWSLPGDADSIDRAIRSASRDIAPAWPLDRQIAVNPWHGHIDQPFDQVLADHRRITGGATTLGPADYRRAWEAGEITPAALARALGEARWPGTPAEAVAALTAAAEHAPGLPLPSDLLDRTPSRTRAPHWRDVITQQVSQYCASYFDEHQADWHRPRGTGLYAGWRASLRSDHALEPLMHAPEIHAGALALPESARAAIAWALARLGVEAADADDLLRTCLLRIGGWAAWCAYLGWQARQRDARDTHLEQLLAIRLAWEALVAGTADAGRMDWIAHWRAARIDRAPAQEAILAAWQRAHEISYQDALARALEAAARRDSDDGAVGRPRAQLVFCIDVRSERLRRHLESIDGGVDTLGFAGFFGLPIEYRPLGLDVAQPQLPGLLAPTLVATESTGDGTADEALATQRRRTLALDAGPRQFDRTPTGSFARVETLGLGYAVKLLQRHFGRGTEPDSIARVGLSRRDAATLRPTLAPSPAGGATMHADQVAGILRAMGLTRDYARLLVLVGHGSQSANNPMAAALDCGACGGHSGEIHARTLAALLNDRAVRDALAARGIVVPADTIALAGLHNTTTDEVQLYDLESIPASHAGDVQHVLASLSAAGHRTRAERSADLGLADLADAPAALLAALRARARDWAEPRPEWGLANNAAFIVAPRARTRGVDLAGRCFLHEYRPADDASGQVLEAILAAPMVVAHWINLQYYASTVDPQRFGSGNKVLHNVAAGRIGVFEGNTGDLRVGLSRQSLHDGTRWMHAPVRLSVVVDAPRERIDAILGRSPVVASLVRNRWVHLFRFAGNHLEQWGDDRWSSWPAPG